MEIKDILRQVYYENNGIYPREGMAITDLFINVLSILLTPFYDDLENLKNQIDLKYDLTDADEAIVDAVASKFFVKRKQGEKVVGNIRCFFDSRRDVFIPEGTVFSTASGLSFITERDYNYSASQLVADGDYYKTPEIRVVAESEGEEYRILAGEIVNTDLDIEGMVDVNNESDFVGGEARETNSELIARVIDGVSTRGLDTVPGIRYKLLTDYGDLIEDLVVIGSGHKYMTRDRVYSSLEAGGVPYKKSSYENKIPGSLSNPNTAYKMLSQTKLPAISDFSDELNQDEYVAVAKQGDAAFDFGSSELLNDDLMRYDENGTSITTNAPGKDWKVGETGGQLFSNGGVSSISVGNGEIALGAIDPNAQPEGTTATFGDGYSPVIQKRLPQTHGVRIVGRFKTSDTNGRLSFVTIDKSSSPDKARAYEGFGFAWSISDPEGRPNIFIVDNDANDSFVNVVGNEMINTKGIETFLAAGTKDIQPDTYYNFEVLVNDSSAGDNAVATEVRIWGDAEARPTTADISYGAYTPMNKRSEDLLGNPQSVDAMDFGIGVLNSGDAIWQYDSLRIEIASEQYAMSLFEIDVSGLSSSSGVADIHVSHSGEGASGGAQAYGSEVYVYNYANSSWELMDENTSSALYHAAITIPLDTTYVSNNVVDVLVVSKYPHDGTIFDPVYAAIHVDYVAVEQSVDYANVGGKVDIYVKNRPSASYYPLKSASVTLSSAPAQLEVSEANGFNVPVARITSIDVLSAGSPTGTQLIENTEYRYISGDPRYRSSAKENNEIIFASSVQGFEVQINYEYFENLNTLQSVVEDESNKKVDSDILVKHLIPSFVSITMTTNYTSAAMEDEIRSYIWSQSKRIEASDIVDIAYRNGATYVNLNTINLEMFYYDDNGNKVQSQSADALEVEEIFVFVPNNIVINLA